MGKIYFALGLMSGTSGDGVDSSIIQTDGMDRFMIKFNNYDPYPSHLSNEIHRIKEKIQSSSDLAKFTNELEFLEAKLTTFHADVAKRWFKFAHVDIIGFHGQTIFHNSEEKISRQLGLGEKLSKLTKKNTIYNFRQNDLKNGGEGAPLAPIYHKLLVKAFRDKKKNKKKLSSYNFKYRRDCKHNNYKRKI